MLRCAPIVLASAILLHAQSPAPGSFDLHVTSTAGAPVRGATVSIEGPDGQVHSGATAADGHFRVANLPPGTYKFVAFDAPGYQRYGGNFLTDVSVHAGHTRAYSFQLVPAPRIEGVVTNEDGSPIGGATVIAEPATPQADARTFAAKTNAHGAFSLVLTSSPESFLIPGRVAVLPQSPLMSSVPNPGQDGPTYYSGNARILLQPGYVHPSGLSFRLDTAPAAPQQ